MFVSCVHHVAVLNAAFCMTWSLLMHGDPLATVFNVCSAVFVECCVLYERVCHCGQSYVESYYNMIRT